MVDWRQVLVVFAILLFAVFYYGLAFLALRDLYRRPAVHGDNKVIWGLLILCLPIVGALYYGYAGAASFLPRTPEPAEKRASRFSNPRHRTEHGKDSTDLTTDWDSGHE